MAGRVDDPQRTRDGGSEELRQKLADGTAPLGLGEARLGGDAALVLDGQLARLRSEAGVQLRQLFIAHQHDEMGLR